MSIEPEENLIDQLWQLKQQFEQQENQQLDLKLLLSDPGYRRIVATKATRSKNKELHLCGLHILKHDHGMQLPPAILNQLRTKQEPSKDTIELAERHDSDFSEMYEISSEEVSLLQDSEFASLVSDTNKYLKTKKQRQKRSSKKSSQKTKRSPGVSSWIALIVTLLAVLLVFVLFWQY